METLAEYIVGKSAPVVQGPMPAARAETSAEFDLLRAEEAAVLLDVHPATVYRWLKGGSLRGFRVGRVVRIRRCDLAEFIRQNLSAQS